MKNKMTERDKKLLIFLALFVIVVGIGYWGVYPKIKHIISYNEEIQDAYDLKAVNEIRIAELPMLESENQRIEQQIAEAKADYYPMMTSDEIDKMFTGKALDYDLYAYNMDIRTEEEETSLPPYSYSVVNEETDEDTDMTEEETKNTVPTGIHTVHITMKLGSSEEENLQRFINDLSSDKAKHLIREYSWENNRRNELVTYENGYDIRTDYETILNISIDIYMCEENTN